MAKEEMNDDQFKALLAQIHQETDSSRNKIEIFYKSRGFFNAQQAAEILQAFAIPGDKIQVIKMMEPRLCRTTCREARSIIEAVSIQNDRLIVLDCVKRVLSDNQTKLGEEYILTAFPFESDKSTARQILNTVRSDVAEKVPAGGHQGYAALGGLYTQSRPLVPHLYGSLQTQALSAPTHGKIEIPPEAQPGIIPSMYTGHPSYAYPPDKSYAETRGYPGNSATMDMRWSTNPPTMGFSYNDGAPSPTRLQNL